MLIGDLPMSGGGGYLTGRAKYARSCILAPRTREFIFYGSQNGSSVRRLARNVFGARNSFRLLLKQAIQLRPSLQNQRLGKLPRGLLPLRRQILHSQIASRKSSRKPAQRFLYTMDAISGR